MSDKPTLVDALSRAGHELLDSVEKSLFGRVGGAESAARGLDNDPIQRFRAEAALDEEVRQEQAKAAPPPVNERQAREERARAELEALKAAQQGLTPEPKKRTL